MKKNNGNIISILLIFLGIISMVTSVHAHSGKTDSNGGHRDNKNKSGLGSYYYHCGGHPAHLHTNGVCPYSSGLKLNKSGMSSSSSSNTNTKSTVPTAIEVLDIKINENVTSMKEGECKKLTATIIPEDSTDKNIVWESSDENIATISATGELIAKKYGTVDVTAISSNGKTSTIKINIKSPKEQGNTLINTLSYNRDNVINNTISNRKDDSSSLTGVIMLGMLGGGSYFGYRKYKNSHGNKK